MFIRRHEVYDLVNIVRIDQLFDLLIFFLFKELFYFVNLHITEIQ